MPERKPVLRTLGTPLKSRRQIIIGITMVSAPNATGDNPACAKVAHFSPPLWHVKSIFLSSGTRNDDRRHTQPETGPFDRHSGTHCAAGSQNTRSRCRRLLCLGTGTTDP